MPDCINIYVATMTGTALMVADDIADFCSNNNINTNITEMDNLAPDDLLGLVDPVLIISSTYGQGDIPDGSKNFYNALKTASPNLDHIKYAIFGLGDMTYKDTFAFGGKKFDKLFDELKASKIGEACYHDASDGTLPEEEAINWFRDKILKVL